MSGANLQHLLAMVLYMAAVVGIGIYFAGRANKDAESYFLGGRSLGPWVTAFSAEASDMSGYLLMGLPGLAYWTGLADAGWTCIGLAIGTLVMTVFGSAFNAVYLLPKFAQLYGIPLDTIIAMGTAIRGGVSNVSTFVLLCVAPLNLLKGAVVSVLTMLLYKRVARPLFGLHQ